MIEFRHQHDWEVDTVRQDNVNRYFDSEKEIRRHETSYCKCGAVRNLNTKEVIWEREFFADS